MGHLTDGGGLRVSTLRLDSVLDSGGWLQPDLVKLDVEGAESDVLEGARKLLAQGRTIWLIALHGEEQRQRVGCMLHEYGYRIFYLDGSEVASGLIEADEIYALPEQDGE